MIGIFDTYGNIVVGYNWDTAWGCNPIPEGLLASTLGTLNPLRYRGYVYDTETGLYYLQSRYYNPEISRFINADALVATGQGLLGNNMFAYCNNNPVNGCDPCGTCFHHWEIWKDCEECASKTFEDYLYEAVDLMVYGLIDSSPFSGTAAIYRTVHYGRNIFNKNYEKEELDAMGCEPLGPSEDKFHQNNQINGRNEKYVQGEWFSSETVFYADGTVNNTPEDRGTFNVYYRRLNAIKEMFCSLCRN